MPPETVLALTSPSNRKVEIDADDFVYARRVSTSEGRGKTLVRTIQGVVDVIETPQQIATRTPLVTAFELNTLDHLAFNPAFAVLGKSKASDRMSAASISFLTLTGEAPIHTVEAFEVLENRVGGWRRRTMAGRDGIAALKQANPPSRQVPPPDHAC